MLCINFVIISPIINGVMEDRICGWGPTLAFFLKDDELFIKTRETVFIYLDKNYDAADTYIRRFEPIREFYERDCRKTMEEIDNERGCQNIFCYKFDSCCIIFDRFGNIS